MSTMRVAESLWHQVIEGLAYGLVLGVPEHLLSGGVKQHDALALIDGDDRIHSSSDDSSQIGLMLDPRLLGQLAIGNVNRHSVQANDLSRLITHGVHVRLNPNQSAIAGNQSELNHVGVAAFENRVCCPLEIIAI